MREKISLQNILSHFRDCWSKLPDARKPNNNTRYSLTTGVLSAFAVFFMQSGSFWAHQRLLEKKKGRSNARSLFQVEEVPSDPQIRNLLDPLASSNFQEDFWFLLDGLKEQHHLQRFRTELNTYAIPMDGITFFSSEKICCPNCLKREDRAALVSAKSCLTIVREVPKQGIQKGRIRNPLCSGVKKNDKTRSNRRCLV
ncbi:MAG: hypothetical protein L6461_03510, partial [Anaerolineae bacterium]|nr:hypothetical protein [Anaerolineae bacterium]